MNRERQVRVGFVAAGVVANVLLGGVAQDHPLVALDVVVQVDAVNAVVEVDVQLEAVVRPRAELERAVLAVEREVGDVDDARALEERLRYP